MINLRQFLNSTYKRQYGHRALALTLSFILCLPQTYAAPKADADEGKMFAVVPISATKDKKNKKIHFQFETRDGETIDMEFQSDPNEQKAFSVIRAQMTAEQEEIKRFLDFVRKHLGLSENFYRMNLGKDEADRVWFVKELVNDYFVNEYYNRLPFHYRKEIQRLYELTLKTPGQVAKAALRRPFSTTIHGFPTQSVLFSAVIGGLMWDQLRTDYAANPMAMIQHLEHMKDPIGHLAFYTFMAANGFSTDMLSRAFADKSPSRAVRGMRAAIPYLGMSAGMLASNLTHEVATLGRACAANLLSRQQSDLEKAMMKAAKMGGAKDPCDEALAEFFNFENKVEQYIPMLFSMALSTGTATFLQMGLVKGGQIAASKLTSALDAVDNKLNGRMASAPEGTPRVGYNGVSSTAKWGNKMNARAAFQYARNAGARATKVVGFILRATPLPTTWLFHSISVGAVLSNVASTYAFLKLDGIIIPWLTKIWAQRWRAGKVDESDFMIRRSFEFNQKSKWSIDDSVGCKSFTGNLHRNPNCPGDMTIHLTNFQKQMEKWRLQNHARFFNGVQIWTMVMNDMVRNVWGAESFYKYYVEQVFLSLKIGQRIKKEGNPKGVETQKAKFLPFMTHPLFGIRPIGHEACTGKNEATCVSEAKLYLDYPMDLIKYQRNTLQFTVNTLGVFFGIPKKELPFKTPNIEEAEAEIAKADAKKSNKEIQEEKQKEEANEKKGMELTKQMSPEGQAFIKQLLIDMQSADLNVLGKAMLRLNEALRNKKMQDEKARFFLEMIHTMLGSPNPILERGMALPYIYQASEKENLKGLEIESKNGYKFDKPVDAFIHQMICGPDEKSGKIMDSIELFGVDMTPPKFNAPRIVPAKEYIEVNQADLPKEYRAPHAPRAGLCVPVVKGIPFSAIYYAKIFVNGSAKPTTLFTYLNSRIKPNILGDFNNLERSSKTYVYSWWDNAVTTPVRDTFGKLDKAFQGLLVDLVEGINNHIEYDFDETGAPRAKHQFKATDASRSLLYSNLQEINVYMNILADIEQTVTNGQGTVKMTTTKYGKILKALDYTPVAVTESQKDLAANLAQIVNLLKQVKIVGSEENRRVVAPQTEKSLRTIQVDVAKALEAYRKHVDALKMRSTYRTNVATISLDGLTKCVTELTGYLLNIQLTNYAALTTYDEYIKSHANDGQKKAPVRTSSTLVGQ